MRVLGVTGSLGIFPKVLQVDGACFVYRLPVTGDGFY
jgi:hypothetical protein